MPTQIAIAIGHPSQQRAEPAFQIEQGGPARQKRPRKYSLKTAMSEWTQADVDRVNAQTRRENYPAHLPPAKLEAPKPHKYHAVPCIRDRRPDVVHGGRFETARVYAGSPTISASPHAPPESSGEHSSASSAALVRQPRRQAHALD